MRTRASSTPLPARPSARLLAGLQQPWSGEVLLDGKPLASIPRHVLANSLALVEQEEFFFPGTVRENLTLWDPTIDDERLEDRKTHV